MSPLWWTLPALALVGAGAWWLGVQRGREDAARMLYEKDKVIGALEEQKREGLYRLFRLGQEHGRQGRYAMTDWSRN